MAVHEPSAQPLPVEAEPGLLTGEEPAAMGDIGLCELMDVLPRFSLPVVDLFGSQR